MLNAIPGKALLSGRFRVAGRRLFFGWARLYADRLVLTGFSWRGLHRRTILLREVARVSWRTDSARAANVTLHLRHDEPVRLWISGAGLWKHRIDDRLGRRFGGADDLPGTPSSASAA